MNRKTRGLLVGTLLGDSSIHTTPHNCIFQFTHQIKQKEFAFHKAEVISSSFNKKKKEPSYYKSNTAYGEVEYYKYSLANKYFNYLHRIAYPLGKKLFSRKLLNYLTPQGIAWWYMDDGGLGRKDINSEMRISTYCSLEEIETIILYFQEVWGIKGNKRLSKKHQTYYLAFGYKEAKKFEKLVRPFILPTMEYKLPSFYSARVLDTLSEGDDIV